MLTDAVADGAWQPEYGLNFALLHVSTAHAFLRAGVWRGHQELWTRAYSRELTQSALFTRTNTTGEDAPFARLWELGVICYERMA